MSQEYNVMASFKADRRFFDDEHFPYGFSRSGEFTNTQAQMLESHGHAYRALASGERLPVTDEEETFVLFCRGGKDAETVHELTWKRYIQNCNNTGVYHSVALNSSSDYSDDFPLDTD